MKRILSLMAMLMMSVAIFAKSELKTVVFTPTPVLKCEKCENRIKGNLKFERGIKAIVPNHNTNTITLTFDASKTTKEKLAKALDKLGYKVVEKK